MKWLETHKHLAMLLVVSLVVLYISHRIVSHFDNAAHDKFVLEKAQVDSDIKTAKTQAVQTDTDKVALQTALNAAAEASRNRDQALDLLKSTLTTQRQKNDSLTPSDLSLRWSNLTGVQPAEIKSTAGGITVSVQAAHTTVNLLEEVSTLRETNKQDQNLLIHQNDLMTGYQKVITDREAELSTCKLTVTDIEKKHKDEIAVIKAKNRKKNFWYGLSGFIGGLILSRKLGV